MSANAGTAPLRPVARVYLALTAGAAATAALPFVRELSPDTPGWPTFLLLAAGAAVTQLFTVRNQRNYSYHMTGVFLVPAILLLPTGLVALMPLVQRLPDWVRRRTPWPLQAFNVSAYTLAVLAAKGGVEVVRATTEGAVTLALAGFVAVTVFVTVQSLVSAPMVMLARRCSLRETGIFTFQGLSTELVLAALGVGVAFLWDQNPWLVPFALAPLLVVHRSLAVPMLEAEARVDAKTGLFNARHFATVLESEFGRARRFERPLSVLMADLDLLREVNNTYGHLAGDVVLREIAEVLRNELRHYDVPARFGGEEFAVVLPESSADEAAETAERIRRAVAARQITVDTSPEPISVTISIGVATFPGDAADQRDLVHQADVAVYRAKVQGRNRVVRAGGELPVSARADAPVQAEGQGRRQAELPLLPQGLLWLVGIVGVAAGALGMVLGTSDDLVGMLAVVGIVALVHALADGPGQESLSVAAVGVISGAALFGPRIAVGVAIAACAVEWGRTRLPAARVAFETGLLTLAALGAAGAFAIPDSSLSPEAGALLAGILAGATYFAVVTALPTALTHMHAGHAGVGRGTLAWTLVQHVSAGLLAGVVVVAFAAAGLWTLVLLTVPLLLARATHDRTAARAGELVDELGATVERLQSRVGILERANEALREHSTELMSALARAIDQREAAGHSREVHRVALAVGARLNLSPAELDVLSHAARFHDIGKLTVPDAVLLKQGVLTEEDWQRLRDHAGEGAKLVEHLAFLQDAAPAIRHHHERFDGLGYPDGLAGDDIPLGARIIHVAEAAVAILQEGDAAYATPADAVLAELERCRGSQFCPRCVDAMAELAHDGLLAGVRRPGAPRVLAQ